MDMYATSRIIPNILNGQASTIHSTHPLTQEQEEIANELLIHSGFYKNEHLILRKEMSSLIEENQRLYRELQSSQKQKLMSNSPGKRKQTDIVQNLQQQLSLTIQEKNSVTNMWKLALTEVDSLERELKAYEGNKHVELAQKQLQQTKNEYSNVVELMEEKLKTLSAEGEKMRLCNEDLQCTFIIMQEDLQRAQQNIDTKEAEMKQGLETTTTAISKIQELEALVRAQGTELTTLHTSRDELEEALARCYRHVEHLICNERKAHNKLQEALSLVDEAMAERAAAIVLESSSREENVRLQGALADLIKEAGVKVKAEVDRVKKDCMERIHILHTEKMSAENQNTEKNSLLEQMKREQQQLSMELESSKRTQDMSFSEHKMQAAFRELTESEHRNYRANLENETLRAELQKLQENHKKFLERKERQWQKAEERYSTVCSQLIAAQEKITCLERQSSSKPCLQSTYEESHMNSNEKMELLARLQEMQTQHFKTDIELQQHLECQRVLKVKWQTTLTSLTNSFELKIRELRTKLQEMKCEKREMQEQLNEALRENNLLFVKEINT